MFMQLESSLEEEDLLLCNIKRGEKREGGRGAKTLRQGAPGSFWHHLCGKLIGLGARLEMVQGQALI